MATIDRLGRAVSTVTPAGGGADQEITSGSLVDVFTSATTVRVNKTIGGSITLVMPTSTSKIGGVLISDWKLDASTNNITIIMSGSDILPGGQTSWTIAADGGSVHLEPIPGVGYAV